VYLVRIIAFGSSLHTSSVSSFFGGIAGLLASPSWPASGSARVDKIVTEGEIALVQAVHLINYNIKSIVPCSAELHQVLDI